MSEPGLMKSQSETPTAGEQLYGCWVGKPHVFKYWHGFLLSASATPPRKPKRQTESSASDHLISTRHEIGVATTQSPWHLDMSDALDT